MARVKRGVTSHAKHKKVLKAAKGYYGRRKNTIRIAKQAVEKAQPIRLPRPQAAQAHLPRALDPAPQRRGASLRAHLQPVYRRARQVRHHGRPQGAVRPRDPRAGRLPGDRREGQGRAAAGNCSGGVTTWLSSRPKRKLDLTRVCDALWRRAGIHWTYSHGSRVGIGGSRVSTFGLARDDTGTGAMIDPAYVQRMARYNRWQNANLYGVADTLSDEERRRERGAFFGSIHKTLSHLLWGDQIWMSRFTPRWRSRRPASRSPLALSRLGRPEARA